MDFKNLTNLAQQAGNITSNPVAQQVLNNPAVSDFVQQAEKVTGMDLDGNGSIVAQAQVTDQIDQAKESTVTK